MKLIPEMTRYRRMDLVEAEQVSHLVRRVFLRHVAPLFSREGIEEFLTYADAAAIEHRAKSGHLIVVATASDEPVGVIEVRNAHHISLLFVDTDFQQRGIGRELLRRALEWSRLREPGLRALDVHASPNAVRAYEHLGFRRQGSERIENGIRFVPMVFDLQQESGGSRSSDLNAGKRRP